jgi:hypothetical protein
MLTILLGMALAPWGAAGRGRFMTDAEEEARAQSGENGRTFAGDWRRNEKEKKISAALEKVANEVGTKHITAGVCTPMLTLAWDILIYFCLSLQLRLPMLCQRHLTSSPSLVGGRLNICLEISKHSALASHLNKFKSWSLSCHLTSDSPLR